MKSYRLNRLFHATSGRCFDVAVDHGFPGEAHFLTGIEDMEAAIATLIDAAPDAIQLAPGQADLLQRHPGRDKPALVMRTDTANIYAPEIPADALDADDRRTPSARPSGSTPPVSSPTCSTCPAAPRCGGSASRTSAGCAPTATTSGCH